jgi:pyridoxal phosphate enzyme (YggS family)
MPLTTEIERLSVTIRERYEKILDRIAAVHPDHPVRLIVVSKAQPLEVVRAAIEAGILVFGENYVDEAVEKIAALSRSGVEWHMIGHVQSRKAEQVTENFSWLHSLDSLKLARRLDRFCGETGKRLSVLLEFNVSGEESKFGFTAWEEARWHDLLPELGFIASLPNLKVMGLMTMPPYSDEAEAPRPYFKKLRRLQAFLQKEIPQAEWSELSMGTSHDFPVAIQEGATCVRIGEAILGPRPRL